MCLSTVYRNQMNPESIAMRNVMVIECQGNKVVLTDLMERQIVLEGELEKANLVDGYVIVKEAVPA